MTVCVLASEALDVAKRAARQAGDIMDEYSAKDFTIENKGTIDLVTEVDLKCEKAIIETIYETFPNHEILAEEEGGSRMEAANRWIIDPIDGTTNYVHGFPMYCASVAYEEAGQVIAGAVFDPTRNEMFTATKGGGAYLNDQKINVSGAESLITSLLATGFPYTITTEKDNNLKEFADMSMKAQAIRRPGAAALDLCYVSCGRLDGFWEFHLQPWDIAAGVLITQEAGGEVSNVNGNPEDIYRPQIIATNGKIHREMLQVLGRACLNYGSQ